MFVNKYFNYTRNQRIMKNTSCLYAALLMVAFTATTAHADIIILTSQFSGAISADGREKVTTWSGLESANASDLLAVFPTGELGFAQPGGAFGSQDQVFVDTNLNVDPLSDLRGFGFALTPGANYDLASLQIETAHATNTGTAQTFSSDLVLNIREGSNTVFSETKSAIAYNGTFLTQNFDLTGISLEASKTYFVEVGMNNLVGDGAYFSSDSLTLSAVPEPSGFAFLAVSLSAGLVTLRRRRKQSGKANKSVDSMR
jgi:hypothetical protein